MIEIIPNFHPVLVHFTIALFATAAGLFFVGSIFSKKSWGDIARYRRRAPRSASGECGLSCMLQPAAMMAMTDCSTAQLLAIHGFKLVC